MKRERHYYVYIITNTWDTTLYVGVTNNLERRIREHRTKLNPNSFSAQYHLWKLVYYEAGEDAYAAISREKQLKNWHREWKFKLIRSMNPTMKDLAEELFGEGATETSSAGQ